MERGKFEIDGTDFRIDPSQSSVTLKGLTPSEFEVNIDIRGDKQAHRRASKTEPWSWSLYPPHFYLHGHRIRSTTKGTVEVRSEAVDQTKAELALYMMEHNDVLDLVVRIVDDGHVEITGMVDLLGNIVPFSIRWEGHPNAV